MKEIKVEILKDAASRLLFDMTEEQYEALLKDFDALSKEMDLLPPSEELQDYEPMVYPFPCEVTSMREDIPEPPLPVEEALANAESVYRNQIKLPKVVDK